MRWTIGTSLLTEYDDEGHLGLQLDPHGDGSASLDFAEHHYGFVARPCDPDEDGLGAFVLTGKDGAEWYSFTLHDPRNAPWLPRLTKGGSCQYGGEAGRALTWREVDGETGTITDYVPVEWDGSGNATKAHKLELGVDGNGAPVVQIVHADGQTIQLFEEGIVIADATGTAYLEVRGGKVTLNGSTKLVGGLDVGGSGGVPLTLQPPLAAALGAFAAAVAAAPANPADGSAALKAALAVAAQALASAAAGMAATMAKSI